MRVNYYQGCGTGHFCCSCEIFNKGMSANHSYCIVHYGPQGKYGKAIKSNGRSPACPYWRRKERMPKDKVMETLTPIHDFFELSYASYFVMPRSALQAMSVDWQKRFLGLMDEMEETFDMSEISGDYWVRRKGSNGRFLHDPFAEYRHPATMPRRKK